MTTQELLIEMLALPVEERVFLADTLFKSLNQLDSEIDQAWLSVAQQRLADIQSQKVEFQSGEHVLARLKEKISQK